MPAPDYLKPGIKVFVVLGGIVAFFIGYNTFLVDNSLEDLKYALNSVERKELGGLDRLLSFTMVAEAAEVRIESDSLANLEYVGAVASSPRVGRPVDDIKDILKNIVSKKKGARAGVLNTLDAANDRMRRVLGISPNLNARLLRNEAAARAILVKEKALESRLDSAASLELKQDILYGAGIIQMKALNYLKAITLFKEAIGLGPDTSAGIKSLFNMAWCEKAVGRPEDSARDFEDFVKRYPKNELAKDAEYQMTIIMRRDGRYREAAEALKVLAYKYEDSLLAPAALFQAAGTYLADLEDKEAAEGVLKRLRKQYLLSEFSSSKTSMFKELVPEEAAAKKAGMAQFIWEKSPFGRAVMEAVDASATRFVIEMIRGAIKYIQLWEWDIGDSVKIEKTDAFLTEWCEARLNVTSKNALVKVRNVSLKFRSGNKIEIHGSVTAGGVGQEFFISGKMELIDYESTVFAKEETDAGRISPNWVVYTVDECRLGPAQIPPEVVNRALARAHKIFNQKVPFEIRSFNISGGTGYWEGPQRASRADLTKEQPEMYEYLYKRR